MHINRAMLKNHKFFNIGAKLCLKKSNFLTYSRRIITLSFVKNLAKFCGIILLAFMFTSCVDYVQSISYKDGNYHLYYKVTFSKLVQSFRLT